MITEKKMHKYQRIIIGLCLILSMISACSPASSVEKEIEHSPEPQPTATIVVPAETEEITDALIPIIDVSEWIVTVGDTECSLESYGDDYPGWYMADCPEQLWFPIGQTTTIEINSLDSETCTISPIDGFEKIFQDLSIEATPVEFVKIEDGGWGCQIPYSNTAGIKVGCGFECEGEGISVIIFGKTIRVYTGGGSSSSGNSDNAGGSSGNSGNENGSEGNQSPPPPPQPTTSPGP